MAIRVIVGIIALACCSVCGVIAALATFEMVDKVNRKLPDAERFNLLGWHFFKYQRLREEYRKMYPDGRLILKVRKLQAFMFACLLVCAWALGFFAK